MYRTTFIIGKISPDGMNLICPEGTYFPNNDRRSIHYPTYYTVTCQHNLFVTVHSVFQLRNVFRQTNAVSLLPFRCFPLFFFSWLVTTTQPFERVEITNVKLIHTSGLEVCFSDMKEATDQLTLLSHRRRWGEKWPDYLRSKYFRAWSATK